MVIRMASQRDLLLAIFSYDPFQLSQEQHNELARFEYLYEQTREIQENERSSDPFQMI
jgi:hypothetical protein